MPSLTAGQKSAVRFFVAKQLGDTDMTVEEFAETLGVTRKTIYNWKETPHFQAEYDRQLAEANDSPDLFALRSRENVLFTYQAQFLRLKKELEGSKNDPAKYEKYSKEMRQYGDKILNMTEHVKPSGNPVTVRDLEDADLIAACLKEEVAPEGMSVSELEVVSKRLKRKGEKS